MHHSGFMSNKPGKLLDFLHKTLSVKPNARWKEEDFLRLLSAASSRKTYLEVMNDEEMPNADTFHYRITTDTEVNKLSQTFLDLTRKQLKKLKGKKAILILDYTCEPFFGYTRSEWIHGYRPVAGSRGCYKFLAASILVGEQRYFVYAKPVCDIADEALEICQILAHLCAFGIKIKAALMDRGFARDSENLALLQDMGIKYLGLYPKYPNIKKIIKAMEHAYKNCKFRVKGVPTRLVIGKDAKRKFAWVFVTNMELSDFWKYVQLYKKRWNIKTGFRMQDEAQIKTKSIDIRVRFFLFLCALVMYNSWKSLRIKMSFKRFVLFVERSVARDERKPT